MSGFALRGDRRRTVLLAVAALVLAAVAAVAAPSTFGQFTAKVTNDANTASSALFAPTTCRAAVLATGSAFFAYPLSETSTASAVADVSGNNRPGAYRNTGFSLNQAAPCPRDTGGAATFNTNNLSTGYVTGPSTAVAGPDTFSVQIWFRTTSTRGGKLIGFGNYNNTVGTESGSYDRHLYLDTNGRLVFGVYPNAIRTLTSPTTLEDGQWHHAVGTLTGGTGENRGMRLYVDGALVGTDLNTTTGEGYSGRWRLGGDNLGTWPNAPANEYFQGSLAWASVNTTALSAEQVRVAYAAGR